MAVTYLTATPAGSRAESVPMLTPQQRSGSSAPPRRPRRSGWRGVLPPPSDLPVMRLVQRAVLGASGSSLIAEVVLGGLLRTVDGRTGSYEFVEGVREVCWTRSPAPRPC